MIYLDHAATTAVSKQVMEEMMPFFQHCYGNPSGVYEFAQDAKEMISHTRRKIGESIHCKPEEIYFTSGGTESDNWALNGVCQMLQKKGKHIITTAIEHPAVLKTCQYLSKKGFEITYLPVNGQGEVDIEVLEQAIRKDTILISVMFANNEIGTIQPIKAIGTLARKYGILFHTDAVQAYLHEPINVEEMGIDLLSASSHKFCGPKGVGFLYIRKGIPLEAFIHGGGQEQGKRAGTENVPGIIGMGKAIAMGMKNFEKNHEKRLAMRDYLVKEIARRIPYSYMNGSSGNRLDNNVNVSFAFLEGESLIILLDMKNICVSAGSACSSKEKNISHVLESIGRSAELARGTIRITLGEENTMEEMETFMDTLVVLVEQLREFSEEYEQVTN